MIMASHLAPSRAAQLPPRPPAGQTDLAVAELKLARERVEHLELAVQSNRRIGMAVGVLIERLKISPEAAFDVLRDASSRSNRKLRDIADEVVLTGEIPTG